MEDQARILLHAFESISVNGIPECIWQFSRAEDA